jgi:hypothetical protein
MQLTGADVTFNGCMTYAKWDNLSAQVHAQYLVTKACSGGTTEVCMMIFQQDTLI